MTNRRLMAGFAVLLLGRAALWRLPDALTKVVGSGPRFRVVGTVPAPDLAEIQSLVRREIWRGVLPNFSWWSIKWLPARLLSREGLEKVKRAAGGH